MNAPETPKPRKKDIQFALTPRTSTGFTGTITAPAAMSPSNRKEVFVKTK